MYIYQLFHAYLAAVHKHSNPNDYKSTLERLLLQLNTYVFYLSVTVNGSNSLIVKIVKYATVFE